MEEAGDGVEDLAGIVVETLVPSTVVVTPCVSVRVTLMEAREDLG